MGSSIAMIDHHYGHLAHDSRQHAVSLLDALAYERAVDAAWTSTPARPNPHRASESSVRTSAAVAPDAGAQSPARNYSQRLLEGEPPSL